MCTRERNDRFLTGNETTDLSEQYRYGRCVFSLLLLYPVGLPREKYIIIIAIFFFHAFGAILI